LAKDRRLTTLREIEAKLGYGMTAKILAPPSDVQALIRAAAFRRLLATEKPVSVSELAAVTGIARSKLTTHLEELDSAGRIRRDESGRVVGSAGLSVTKDRHEIELDGRRFWTWCAYDFLGIFGALKARGRALTPSPDGRTVEVRFEGGRPVDSDAVLFLPDVEMMSSCGNVYAEWCPNSNLFSDAEQATEWANERGIRGGIMSLADASNLGAMGWADVV
jgi:alkylmercury lyase